MLTEIVNFTKNLDQSFKDLAVKPKNGLHILIDCNKLGAGLNACDSIMKYDYYNDKMGEESEFIQEMKFFQNTSWMIDPNKSIDGGAKKIHSASPYCVAFKKINLAGIQNNKEYFDNANKLIKQQEVSSNDLVNFQNLFLGRSSKSYTDIFNYIEEDRKNKLQDEYKELDAGDYIIFYSNFDITEYKEAQSNYYSDKLFNTNKYNTDVDIDVKKVTFGTSNFFNGYNIKKPFLIHKTATFDINYRITTDEAKLLFDFQNILASNILPNPLPIFIFKEELNERTIGLFKDGNFKLGYKEIIEGLYELKFEDISNYYLINWNNTKGGLAFNDIDYVTEFKCKYELEIKDLFGIKFKPEISNIFEFQNQIVQTIFNNNLIVRTKEGEIKQKYFDNIESKYCKSDRIYILILKYRYAFYDFIYKSNRSAITQDMFNDIMQTSILEDIRLDKVENGNHSEHSNILKKLNIWFSLYETFNHNFPEGGKTMASKLLEYNTLLDDLLDDKFELANLTDEQFMFCAGQVIAYLISKSKSSDNSYQLLEPYTQKSNCREFIKAISNDVDRYKHQPYSNKFKKVASAILTYETGSNIKNYLPELLAGVFSVNKLKSNNQEEVINE